LAEVYTPGHGNAKILQHDKSILKITDLCTTDAICLHTDGSKLEGHVGGGVYSEKLDIRKSFRLPDHCIVFQAEVHAIKEA